ncbi:MAG TPA: TetR/AcrR family transcriptional regulator [Streptosporangiaceae bacterium]|nr:TetR/AcrR family transcriptional regulator [Streptosporangiaceae bacterium]
MGAAQGRPADRRRERWSVHREQRRREFVDAALRVLESHGPDLPVDAVAAEAGVTKPVLYRYFDDKAALVQALAERGSQMLRDRLLPAISADLPSLASVNDGVSAYFAVIDEHPNLYWLLARHGHAANSDAIETVQHNRDLIATALTSVIGDYLRAVGMDSGAAEPWAYGITGLVQSTGEWWLQRRSMSRTTVADYVTKIIWAAISGMLRDAGIAVDPDQPFPETRPPLHAVAGKDARLAPG